MAGSQMVTNRLDQSNAVSSKTNLKKSRRVLIDRSVKILVVEDEALNQLLIVEMLRTFGYVPKVAVNAKEALALYDKTDYKIIFMDIGLPDMSGLEVCKKIRQNEGEKKVPIVAVTAYGEQVKEQCVMAGMDEFITKPIDMVKLGMILNKYLSAQNSVNNNIA